jgi:hypothetical protein
LSGEKLRISKFVGITIFVLVNLGSLNAGEGSVFTVNLLVLASLDQLVFILKFLITFFYKTSYLNEEVNCTEPSPSVRVP